MDTPITKKQFLAAYYRFQNWDYEPMLWISEDRRVTDEFPLFLHRSLDKIVVQTDESHLSLREPIDESSSNQAILEALGFDNLQIKEHTKILFAMEPIELPDYEGLTIKSLTEGDKIAVGQFKAMCTHFDQRPSLINLDDDLLYGVYHQSDLLALGSIWVVSEDLSSLQLLVHPKFRNVGLGYLLFGWLIRVAFRKNTIPFVVHDASDSVITHLALKAKLVEALSSYIYTTHV